MIMMLATPTARTISATTPNPEKEAAERPRRSGPGGEHVGRLAHVHLVRRLGVGGLREQRLHRRLMTGGGDGDCDLPVTCPNYAASELSSGSSPEAQ
jgi:hypothetical protein